ncbi:TIGR02099 family protein [Paucibacter sp. KBW04]|uniref:YhdP family protein n=1 Tax=Paucibacter sp. KBW04 TaxID=2153361 RepID=UPI000F58D88A|nr:YhdP family protein [Paucibacter sp. KBW04]RQO54724.1 TIGR02099 family protein [Paucibacter sp. KBW04]
MAILANLKLSAARRATRPARIALRCLRWLMALVLALWGLLLLAWLVLHWAILPHIDEWRPALERRASAQLGVDLRIGSITVTSGGWIPAVEMREVVLLDPRGREALRLPKVAAALSARSLLSLQPRFEQLLIDAPQMEVRRDAQGHIFVAGLNVDAVQRPETADLADDWLDWLLVQREFVILNGRVRWVDESRAAPPLELSALNLVLRNRLGKHDVRLDATPPADWGQRFSLQGRFSQALLKRPGELKFWSGQLFADLPQADLRQLRRHVNLPFELSEGDGGLRAWVDIDKGLPQSVTADVGLRRVKLRLSPAAGMLDLTQIEGRLQLQRQKNRLSLAATQLGFVAGDGVVWPRSDWSIALDLAPAKPQRVQQQMLQASQPDEISSLDPAQYELNGGELNAQRLDFALMAQLAQRLPMGPQARAWLADVAPRGVLSGLKLHWEGAVDAPKRYSLKGRIEGLSLSAGELDPQAGAHPLGRPGVRGASLELEATERGGKAQLLIEDGVLEMPGLFESAQTPIRHLSTALDWRIEPRLAPQPAHIEIRFNKLKLATPDAQGEFKGVWQTSKDEGNRLPGHLELTGSVERIAAARVRAYMPLAAGEATRGYLLGAIRGGEARNVQVRLRGALQDFPFDAGRSGVFRITAQAQDVDFAYVPPEPGQPLGWPALQHAQAELIFDRGGMAFRSGRAQVLGYEVSGVNGSIKDLAHARVLELEGQGRGPAAELLRYLHLTPIEGWTGGVLAQAQATGPASLKLALKLPLLALEKVEVKGQVGLSGNDLRVRPEIPLLANARGRVEFDQKSVHVVGAQARALGGDLTVEGGTLPGGAMSFTMQGLATAEGLRRSELPALQRLAQLASGQANYRLQLGVQQGHADIKINSTLQGLALDLPAPLRKEAETALPLLYQTSTQANREELRLELGSTLQALYQRDVSGESPRVLRGAINLQDSKPQAPLTLAALPSSGVQMTATVDKLNLDAWRELGNRLESSKNAPASADAGLAYQPNQIALRAQQLLLSGRTLSKVVAGISRSPAGEPESWRATLDAEQLSGFVELRPPQGVQGAKDVGRVYARLARLSLPKQEADSVTQLLDKGALDKQPGSVPALDIVVEQFELRGKQLGRLEVQAQASGPQRDWRLTKLQLKAPDAVLNATGHWLNEPGQPLRRTELDWRLDIVDAGATLERLGQGRVLRGGKGHMEGQLGWQGSPLSPDYASMNGALKLTLESGQFLNAEPGVGRLLGVLSLQSLPRRFLLDFRDVFSEGFTFDGVTGDVKIAQGLASSSNLRMRGLQATVALEGEADLATETQNLRVLVVPEFSMGGASLAYAAINPAIGLGAFLAQLLLSRPVEAAGTREFHITGTWVEPKVEERGQPVKKPAPVAGPASGPASGAQP